MIWVLLERSFNFLLQNVRRIDDGNFGGIRAMLITVARLRQAWESMG